VKTILATLWLCWFGGDVDGLSDRDYKTRVAATKSLASAGVWGLGAALIDPATPEAADRIGDLLTRQLNRLPFMVQLWACSADRLSDEFVLSRAEDILGYVERWGQERVAMTLSTPHGGDEMHWGWYTVRTNMTRPPWYSDSQAGDYRMLLKNLTVPAVPRPLKEPTDGSR
jgi:hypothetical protein